MSENIDFKDIFIYSKESPSFLKWNISICCGNDGNITRVSKGDDAGSINSKGYYHTQFKAKSYKVHHIIWELFNGPFDTTVYVIDHLDGNPLNNDVSNLKKKSRRHNSQNMRKRADNTSGTTGITVVEHNGYIRYRVYWSDLDGKIKSKSFSTNKYGKEEAWKRAREARDNAISKLNLEGADYTERHGK